MGIKYIYYCFFATLLITVVTTCACEEDEFGEVLRMEIPVNTGSERNTYRVGDTLWVEANFPKTIEVVGNNNDIELIDYKFFSELNITEISEEELRFYSTPDIFVKSGAAELNQVGGYSYEFDESENGYRVSFGIVLLLPGVFMSSSRTDSDELRGYSHPAHYVCGDNGRMNVFVNRINRFTTMENFEYHNEWNRVVVENFVQTFEGYRRGGAFTFRVVE